MLNLINDIISNSTTNNNIYCEFYLLHKCNRYVCITFILVPISTVFTVTVLVMKEQELLLMA